MKKHFVNSLKGVNEAASEFFLFLQSAGRYILKIVELEWENECISPAHELLNLQYSSGSFENISFALVSNTKIFVLRQTIQSNWQKQKLRLVKWWQFKYQFSTLPFENTSLVSQGFSLVLTSIPSSRKIKHSGWWNGSGALSRIRVPVLK